MSIRIKIAAASLAATGALAGMSGIAHANDCFNASRSVKGATQAGVHSGQWYTVQEMLELFLPDLTEQQVDSVMAVVNSDPRIPQNFVMYLNEKTFKELAASMPERLATDGKGIDHADDLGIFPALDEDLAIGLGGGNV